MRNIEGLVKEYISKQTEYAIQIVGNWGNGKTFFFRNNLEDLILDTPIFDNHTKKYKPIYISLFGLKSTEDIATKIVLEFYQSKFFKGYFRNKRRKRNLRVTQGIFKIGLRGFLNFHKLGNVNDFITDIHNTGKDVLDISELVICFDDLERMNSTLKLEDLAGYINSLVDEGIKVLIITNEDILIKEEKYKNLKEKIIGITVPFLVEPELILKSIIENRYSGFPEYTKLLNNNLDIFIKISISAKNNYRHIIYALDCLQHFYSVIRRDIIDIKHEITTKLKENLDYIMWIAMAFAVEYKSSKITFQSRDEFGNGLAQFRDILGGDLSIPQEINENEEMNQANLLKKYGIPRREYRLFDSVFVYVTGRDEFDSGVFIEEFKILFHWSKGDVLPHYKILNSLGQVNFMNLTDKEYEEFTNTMIAHAINGDYSPSEYLTVMFYIERLDNILNLDLEEISDKLILGLKKSIANTPLNRKLESSAFNFDSSNYSINAKKIHMSGKEDIRLAIENRKKQAIDNLAEILVKKHKDFQDKYSTESGFKHDIDNSSILNNLQIPDLLSMIKIADNETIYFLKDFFEERYKHEKVFKEEVEQVKKLIDSLHEYIESLTDPGNKLKIYFLRELLRVLIANRDKPVD